MATRYEVTSKITDAEIDDQLNKADEQEESGGSRVPGMSYEQGVKWAILWLTGASEDKPIEDD